MSIELPVSEQAVQFALSGAMGLALGLGYDLLRSLRRKRPRLTAALDLLFGLLTLTVFAAFALYAGNGRFRLFAFPGAALGAALYLLTLSPVVLRVWMKMLEITGFCLKKTKNFWKKIFSFLKKWSRILHKKRQAASQRKAGDLYAARRKTEHPAPVHRAGAGGHRHR